MAGIIARQPNGKLCRWSTNIDSITDYNMSEDEYVEMCAERAREEAREVLQRHVHPWEYVFKMIDTAVKVGSSYDDVNTINKMLSEIGSEKQIEL